MDFFDLKGLIVHLQNNKPTSRESFQYVMAYMLTSLLETTFSKYYSNKPAPAPADLQQFLINLVIVAFVAFISYLVLRGYYNKNGGDSGKYFLDRLIAIVWVVGCRVGIVLIPLIALFLTLKPEIHMAFALFLLAAVLASLIYMFLTIRSTFEKIRLGSVVD